MEENILFKTYLQSWPATLSTVLLMTIVMLLLLYRKEIKKKISAMMSIGGNKGARWSKSTKGKFPTNSLAKIQSDQIKAAEEIESLKTQKDEIVKLALNLNQELEDTKTALFFERMSGAMLAWQYFLLKLGYEAQNHRLSINDAIIRIRSVYPDLDAYVSAEHFIATLNDLKNLKFIDVIPPYTNETIITFTEISITFMQYIARKNT